MRTHNNNFSRKYDKMVTEIVIMNFLDMGMTNSIQFLIQNDIP